MLNSLEAIVAYRKNKLKAGELSAYPWLAYLVSAEERVVNIERIGSLQELANANPVLDYVERSLQLLNELTLSFWMKDLLEQVLCWSEAAKGGTLRERMQWRQEGVNFLVHNVGSAQLYERLYGVGQSGSRRLVVRSLIEGHGYVGQLIRGEVPLADAHVLTNLAASKAVTEDELARLLHALAYCVIGAVSLELWDEVRIEVEQIIQKIASGDVAESSISMSERLRRMRRRAVEAGENFAAGYEQFCQVDGIAARLDILQPKTFWFAEPAMQHFALEDFLKLMLLAASYEDLDQVRHVSFERLMQTMYYDYRGKKTINVYKLRIIEHYMHSLSTEQLVGDNTQTGLSNLPDSPHLQLELQQDYTDTLFVSFRFSPAAEKLIAFCVEAEKSPLYEQAVLLLFDLFGLRRDEYDRLHNEENYLADMNGSIDQKRVLLQYVKGRRIVDIGPGGGALLDLLEQEYPAAVIMGIDIATNVIEALTRKRQLEGKRWEVRQGNALELQETVGVEAVDTIIFSSILHELFSYIPYEGHKFNQATIDAALTSAFEALAPGGRILIRDGVMTASDQKRRIRFLEPDGMDWLIRYAAEFKGRSIVFEQLNETEAILPINDAMEFLYTYTWGAEAFVHEVQEQFGVCTLTEYEERIRRLFGERAQIIVSQSYLQDGYAEALEQRITLYNEQGETVQLPDSTMLLVIEKIA